MESIKKLSTNYVSPKQPPIYSFLLKNLFVSIISKTSNLPCFFSFRMKDYFFFLSWVRWSCPLWWIKGNRLLYLGNDCFVLCFGEFLPLWEELAWCCSGEKKNLWSGCRLCFSEEVINRIVWAQKILEMIVVAILLVP